MKNDKQGKQETLQSRCSVVNDSSEVAQQ